MLEYQKSFTLLLFLFIFLLFITNILYHHQHKFYQTFTAEKLSSKGDDKKIILFWNSFFEQPDFGFGFGSKPFEKCSISNCRTTNDKTLLNDSTAVLIHMRSPGHDIEALRRWRQLDQYLVFYLRESPKNSMCDKALAAYNGLFNLSMTYRPNSDIEKPYFRYIEKKMVDEASKASLTRVTTRPGHVAWVSSNCWSMDVIHGRQAYITQLQKYIKVNKYGRCPTHHLCGSDCFLRIAKKNKFYFAAENSLCRDYVTEKPWKALQNNMIPVVYGLANYSEVLPPNSFIDVKDHPSPSHLANYLHILDTNNTLFSQYFEWKKRYKIVRPEAFCDLCKFLNQKEPPIKTISTLDKFWSCKNDCVSPHGFNAQIMKNTTK